MKKQLLVYGSRYGSTKRYAERLAEMTGVAAIEYSKAKNLADYDRVVYLGGIFAGGVMGLKKTAAKMNPRQELVIATVGVTDPKEAAYFESIRQAIKAQLPEGLYNEEKVFHLRGAIDYNHLSVGHSFMMKMFHSMMLNKSEAERTADAKAMLETYGRQVDFVDLNALQPIADLMKE